ncbi:hypothetical protein MNB_ARC-1_155 [hydrothermal vent metagenome]|uniref:Uncharacterized protein n=1 Tax=hydrothermal vent metagenome TaxID=652676 RepID=A0A3B1E0M2_9ZZZZ
MILIGDQNIICEQIEKINNISDIKNTKPNATLLFKFDIDILKYIQKNDLNSAVLVNSIKDAIYASSLEAKYIIPSKNILKRTQELADNYMFDSKILATIDSSDDIENIALNHIDGVIYKSIIDRSN